MSDVYCRTRFNCTGLAVIASVIIGVITAFLTLTAAITIPTVFLWVVSGVALLFLALAFLVFVGEPRLVTRCACGSITALLVGILGTLLTAVILLAIDFAATSIIGAIITGLLLTFVSIIVTVTACIIRCATACNND